jgi:hypothetical protein
MIDFGMGVITGGLALSACWGWLWLVIGTIGVARGACRLRVVTNSLVVGITPLLLGWGIWWMRPEAFSPSVAFVAGMFTIPLLLTSLALRKASDGRPVGLHLVEGIRRLKDELLATHHECGECGHDHGADGAGGSP